MKKSCSLLLVLMLLLMVSASVLVAEEVSGDFETEMTVEKVEITDYERQSVNSQLEVALMALTLPEEEEMGEDGSEEGNTMDEVAERHAFIAWAHYNHVPPSRKLQEYLSTPVTELVQDVEVNELGQTVDKVDEFGNPVMIENTTTAWNWEEIKSAILAGDYSFVENVTVPDGLKSTGNPDGANWGQFKKTLEVQTATMVMSNSQNKVRGNNGNRGGNGNNGNNGKGGENGNKGGNGKGEGKGQDK